MPSLFGWKNEGIGLQIQTNDRALIAHEVFSEGEILSMDDTTVFLGASLSRSRYRLVLGVLGCVIFLLLSRAFWMQIVQGDIYGLQAEENRLRHDVISAKRGIIYDRNGVILADNLPAFDVYVVPRLLPQDTESREAILGRVAQEIGWSIQELTDHIATAPNPGQRFLIFRDLAYERSIALRIVIEDHPAFTVSIGNKRRYAISSRVSSISHVLGYAGIISPEELASSSGRYVQTDIIGKTGVEAAAEAALHGKDGERVYEVDAMNHITGLVREEKAEDGQDVHLTIDIRLQEATEQALRREMERAHVARASAVALDPRDGSVLALVSLPAYDNNIFSGSVSNTAYAALLNNPEHPLLPRAWAGVYPAGSTIKPVIATAALEEGIITPQTTIQSVGGIRIGQSFFPDWKAGGHGTVNVRSAIAWSANTFFYYIGGGYDAFRGLGVDRLTSWFRRFGLGDRVGFDLPGERPGFIPSPTWKEEVKHERWYVGDTYNISIGQGDILVTPLQVAAFTANIANNGFPMTPHVLQGGGVSSSLMTPLASAASLRAVRLGMRDTVLYGSGRALAGFPVAVAGKTGTAQWRSDRPNHAWFTAFAPFDEPEIALTVLLEEGGEGSATAVPVAREMLHAWYGSQRELSRVDKPSESR